MAVASGRFDALEAFVAVAATGGSALSDLLSASIVLVETGRTAVPSELWSVSDVMSLWAKARQRAARAWLRRGQGDSRCAQWAALIE